MPGRYRSDTLEQRISIERLEQAVNIFGSFDSNIRLLEQEFHVTVVNRDGEIRVEGEPEDTMLAVKAIQTLLTLSSRGEAIGEQNVRYVIGLVRSGKEAQITELTGDVLCISAKGRPIKPKTIGQKEYIKSVLKNTVTIGVGPAGTGKTYLAVAAAVQAFRDKQVNRIILTFMPEPSPLEGSDRVAVCQITFDRHVFVPVRISRTGRVDGIDRSPCGEHGGSIFRSGVADAVRTA